MTTIQQAGRQGGGSYGVILFNGSDHDGLSALERLLLNAGIALDDCNLVNLICRYILSLTVHSCIRQKSLTVNGLP